MSFALIWYFVFTNVLGHLRTKISTQSSALPHFFLEKLSGEQGNLSPMQQEECLIQPRVEIR